MAGSHEVRGSNPLFSTMNSIAGRAIDQRFFYLQVKESEPREGSTVVLIPLRANFLKRGRRVVSEMHIAEGNSVFRHCFPVRSFLLRCDLALPVRRNYELCGMWRLIASR